MTIDLTQIINEFLVGMIDKKLVDYLEPSTWYIKKTHIDPTITSFIVVYLDTSRNILKVYYISGIPHAITNATTCCQLFELSNPDSLDKIVLHINNLMCL